MTDAKKITETLGRDAIASAVGVKSTAVITQVSSGTFPAAWFDAIDKMARKAGVECPRHAFRFKPHSVTDGAAA